VGNRDITLSGGGPGLGVGHDDTISDPHARAFAACADRRADRRQGRQLSQISGLVAGSDSANIGLRGLAWGRAARRDLAGAAVPRAQSWGVMTDEIVMALK
jgi:hypothetical protein